jgi:DNA adenine methylase
MRDASPLRYPGGKWRFSRYFERLINLNYRRPPTYIEPYAGGSSLALSLLFSDVVDDVCLNDLDPAIHAFWHCVLRHTERLCELIDQTPITPTEWRKQRRVYQAARASEFVALGFATFFLNRTNHSGILNGGMIGGKKQLGEWRLNARFNRPELIRRIQRIATFRSRIHLYCQDAIMFLKNRKLTKNTLVYLDPPYYDAGKALYLNAYEAEDHARVRDRALNLKCPWVVSYDDVREIRKLYKSQRSRSVRLLHTARSARVGREVMFFSPKLQVPMLFL